jgi:hypothetical protein
VVLTEMAMTESEDRRARLAFVEDVAEFLGAMGGPAEAELVAALYIKDGIAKIDGMAYRVKNGMFFDSGVLVRAVAIARAAARKAVAA